jgi:hypothetical protein
MAHPVCLFFNYEDLPEEFLKELTCIASEMLCERETERNVKSAEFQGRIFSHYELGFYENFEGTIFYGEVFLRDRMYRVILLTNGENLENKSDLSMTKNETHEQVSTLLRHMEVINRN